MPQVFDWGLSDFSETEEVLDEVLLPVKSGMEFHGTLLSGRVRYILTLSVPKLRLPTNELGTNVCLTSQNDGTENLIAHRRRRAKCSCLGHLRMLRGQAKTFELACPFTATDEVEERRAGGGAPEPDKHDVEREAGEGEGETTEEEASTENEALFHSIRNEGPSPE
ncbi:hypothetical protein KC349_g326 [Hortaea werneckii]|nr:hypothetical protein KC349_g326 [Hortaea werneckii]